jgi:hypothetical protein
MFRRAPVLVAFCVLLAAASACGPEPDLRTSLKLVPTISGYYDDGVLPSGESRLLPSLTFQLKNEGDLPIDHVDLVIAYWEVGADGENDSNQIKGIGSDALAPGQTSEPMTVRASIGYKGYGARADFFTSVRYRGFIVKVFAKRRGKTTPLGEFPVEQRVLPTARKDGARP